MLPTVTALDAWRLELAGLGLLLGLGMLAWRGWRRRRRSPLYAFAMSMREACDEGERAYRQQLRLDGRTGADTPLTASMRGLALARFLPALFPAAAFLLLRGTHMLHPDIQAAATREDFDPVRLASGLALGALDLTPAHPDHAEIREDADMAARLTLDLLLGEPGQPPLEQLGRARRKLGALWQYALSLSCAEAPEQATGTTPPIPGVDSALQFFTSGLSRFADWIVALRR